MKKREVTNFMETFKIFKLILLSLRSFYFDSILIPSHPKSVNEPTDQQTNKPVNQRSNGPAKQPTHPPTQLSVFQGNFSLQFCRRWSRTHSWFPERLPQDGDNVTVENGQSLLLDTNTSVLNLLLIKGLWSL